MFVEYRLGLITHVIFKCKTLVLIIRILQVMFLIDHYRKSVPGLTRFLSPNTQLNFGQHAANEDTVASARRSKEGFGLVSAWANTPELQYRYPT